MFNDEEIELTDAERAALAALPRERPPSDLLEGRVMNELRSRGFLSPASRRQNRFAAIALRSAAAILIFMAGALTERFVSDRSAQTEIAPAQPVRTAQVELWI
jgi:hypothetical protein